MIIFMLKNLNRKLSKLSAWQVTTFAITILSLIAYLDYITGYEISVAFFYMGPIVLVTWYMGKKAGIIVSLLSGSMLLAINILSLHVYSHPAIRYLNTCLDLMGYFTITFLVSELNNNIHFLKRQRDQLNELAKDYKLANKRLVKMSAHLITSVEKERYKISREIHDDLGGCLTAIKMGIASLAGQLVTKQPTLIEKTKYLEYLVDCTYEIVRRITGDLRTNIIGLGIVNALEWQASQFD
jgi:signal transduction histidine kinase